MSKLKQKGLLTLITYCWLSHCLYCQQITDEFMINKVNVTELMSEGDIPGLSLVIITDGQQVIKNYGYADLEDKIPVTSTTLFELGSCSKAFTALAVENLVHQKKLKLDASVSDYIPWFRVKYKGKFVEIKVAHLLHHTSGIPWNTISKIPQTTNEDGLEQTVRQLIGQKLNHLPGKEHEYATINYDVLALIIEKITNQSFETYIQQNIFQKLKLLSTSIGSPINSSLMSTGYKISFLSPIEYKAPVFKGNYAAGYVISNAQDMAVWLKFQLGILNSQLYPLAQSTHRRDETVPLHGMSSYAEGWEVSLSGSGEIYHGGLNPNYTAYVAFRPKQKIGVVVMANSNSTYTEVIGHRIIKILAGEEEDLKKEYSPGDHNDKIYSILSLVILIYIMAVIAFLCSIIIDIMGKRRTSEHFTVGKFQKFIRSIFILLPFLYGLYLFPEAIAGFTWESIFVWSPESLKALAILVLVAMASSSLVYFISLCFPEKKNYKGVAAQILLMSILSGLSNVIIIIMVTSVIETESDQKKYFILYYVLALGVYLLGRRFVQINLIKFTRKLIWDLTTQLTSKIFSTSYQKFERIDRGRVYTALNDDVNTIGHSTSTIITLITSVITAVGAFLYLASIAFWASLLTILIIVSLSALYYFVSISTNVYFKKARDSRDVFMRLINGMIDGFKEISLHRSKKLEYKSDITTSATEYREKISTADIRFVNAFLVGESLLVILLGIVAFGMNELFPNVKYYTVMNFVIILLYLIGPINGILGAVPALMNLKIAWNRLQKFIKEIPANLNLDAVQEPEVLAVESIEAKGVTFQYGDENSAETFNIGPINLEVCKGEVVFIIGGNGSGKTTLAKLLTGLYSPDGGQILINKKVVKPAQLSEYFSAVFSPPYLFEKLYDIDAHEQSNEIQRYLQLLDLEDKVKIVGNKYSTIELSGGQRKRLALLQCYLENYPIYLFDEWAADQDPDYRNFFYTTLLPEMKKAGKIVIAITHDDNYFYVADRVLKMCQGRLETYSKEYSLTSLGLS